MPGHLSAKEKLNFFGGLPFGLQLRGSGSSILPGTNVKADWKDVRVNWIDMSKVQLHITGVGLSYKEWPIHGPVLQRERGSFEIELLVTLITIYPVGI